jgi:ribosomal protein S18 acetylase RimI-like enzyme
MGMGFLRKLYRGISLSKHSFLIIAIHKEDVVGFICGSTNTKKLRTDFIIRYGFSFIPFVLRSVMARGRIRGLLETLCYPDRKEVCELPGSEILNFCVTEKLQKLGLGRKLFSALIDEFRKRGKSEIKIVTGCNQYSAQRFYESAGARLSKSCEIHSGTGSFIYVFTIPRMSV